MITVRTHVSNTDQPISLRQHIFEIDHHCPLVHTPCKLLQLSMRLALVIVILHICFILESLSH